MGEYKKETPKGIYFLTGASISEIIALAIACDGIRNSSNIQTVESIQGDLGKLSANDSANSDITNVLGLYRKLGPSTFIDDAVKDSVRHHVQAHQDLRTAVAELQGYNSRLNDSYQHHAKVDAIGASSLAVLGIVLAIQGWRKLGVVEYIKRRAYEMFNIRKKS